MAGPSPSGPSLQTMETVLSCTLEFLGAAAQRRNKEAAMMILDIDHLTRGLTPQEQFDFYLGLNSLWFGIDPDAMHEEIFAGGEPDMAEKITRVKEGTLVTLGTMAADEPARAQALAQALKNALYRVQRMEITP